VAGLTLGLGASGSLAWRFLAKKAPTAALPPVVEPALPPILSSDDQGYVDCPEEMDPNAVEEIAPLPEGAACLADRLPWGQAPEPFRADTSLDDLKARCGEVFADFLFYRGEGRCQWGTAMLHGTDREIQITWHNWREKKIPRSLRFVGPELYFENGMRPGIPLKDLAALNGQAITLAAFGWEGSGVHQSFQNGTLQGFDSPDSPYRIQYALDWELFDNASEEELASIIVGESPLESTEPTLEKLKAKVEYVEYSFMKNDDSMREPL
jgi:hypothetical protein